MTFCSVFGESFFLKSKKGLKKFENLFSAARPELTQKRGSSGLQTRDPHCEQRPGDDCGGATPLSIPNREVKTTSAENT